jgi:hypothetical protein
MLQEICESKTVLIDCKIGDIQPELN